MGQTGHSRGRQRRGSGERSVNGLKEDVSRVYGQREWGWVSETCSLEMSFESTKIRTRNCDVNRLPQTPRISAFRLCLYIPVNETWSFCKMDFLQKASLFIQRRSRPCLQGSVEKECLSMIQISQGQPPTPATSVHKLASRTSPKLSDRGTSHACSWDLV